MSVHIRELGHGSYGKVNLRQDAFGGQYARKQFRAQDLRHATDEFDNLLHLQHANVLAIRVFFL
jgi:hypothetical protein